MSDIDFSLWELPPVQPKKIQGIGYSSVPLSREDKNTLSYILWKGMISSCYSTSKTAIAYRKGRDFECSNKWLDYQNFLKWFNDNYKDVQRTRKDVSMNITRCIISSKNIVYNPNNCAIVPKDINMYLQKEKRDCKHLKYLAEKYKDYITYDVYMILTEGLYE